MYEEEKKEKQLVEQVNRMLVILKVTLTKAFQVQP